MEKDLSNLEQSKALNEIKNSNKNISKAFIFEKRNILAKDERVIEEEAIKTVEAFDQINAAAEVINGVESITIQGANGRVDITRVNDRFLATVASKEATDGAIDNLMRVLAPTILKRPEEKMLLTSQPGETLFTNGFKQKTVGASTEPSGEQAEFAVPPPESEFAEFTVDSIGRLDIISASHNTVRLDAITIGRWTELYGEDKIHNVIVRVPNSDKTMQCKLEEIKEPKEGQRNTVLMPEVMQRTLRIKKGAAVLIKPLTEQEPLEEPAKETVVKQRPEERVIKKDFLQDSPACQLIVEDLTGFGGFMGNDTVRFDEDLIERWREFYGQEKIEEVVINDILLGKSVRCKFKIQKNSEFEGKGRIQIPKSIRQKLMIKEGSLVTIKPVVK